MKTNALIIIIFLAVLLSGCGKDEPETLYREPILDWSLTKQEVKDLESRTLIADRGPDYALIIAPEFESRGDGSLEYKGENEKVTSVSYLFYCDAGTLVAAYINFVSNDVVLAEVKANLENRYGTLYTLDNYHSSPRQVWHHGGVEITLNLNTSAVWISFIKDPLKTL